MRKRVRVGALDIEYEDVGEGQRPFVMVHGFTGSRDDFADVLEPITTLGRVLAPDLRGHGGTTNPGVGYSLEQLAADLGGFLDAVGIPSCDLLGHSLGGMIVLRFTLNEPKRVDSLVLMNTAARAHAKMPEWAFRVIRWGVRWIPMRWHWRAIRAFRRRMPAPMQRAQREMGPDRYWDRLRRKLEALDPVVFDTLLRAIVEQEPVTNRLHEIRCPTLVLVGEEDADFLKSSREMAEAIPEATLVVIENAHHSPQMEATPAWLAAIRDHLQRVRA